MSLDENFLDTREQKILELYDQLEQITLECSLLEAQNTTGKNKCFQYCNYFHLIFKGRVDDVNEEIIKTAQDELLDSQALYSLRNNILESILIANPVLKAVHAGQKASLVERYVFSCQKYSSHELIHYIVTFGLRSNSEMSLRYHLQLCLQRWHLQWRI